MILAGFGLAMLFGLGMPAAPQDWVQVADTSEATMWIDRASVARRGKQTGFALKLQPKQKAGYSIQTASVDCATRDYDMLSITLYDGQGKQTASSTSTPGESTGTMANEKILGVVCGQQAASAASVPAGQPDWRLVGKDAKGQMRVDARSVRQQGPYRWYRGRLQIQDIDGYGYTEALADCRNKKTQLLRTSMEQNGEIGASSEAENKNWVPLTSSGILSVVCGQ